MSAASQASNSISSVNSFKRVRLVHTMPQRHRKAGIKMDWYDNGGGMMNGSGYAIFWMVLMAVFFVLLVWLIFRVVDHGAHSDRHHGSVVESKGLSPAVEHLNMRLAKGEVSAEEYVTLKGHLLK